MGDAKKKCAECHREPGSPHNDFCSRSWLMLKELKDRCDAALRRVRLVWTKGPMLVRTAEGTTTTTFNPGIPYARGGKSWERGGTPKDQSGAERFQKVLEGESRPDESASSDDAAIEAMGE